MAKNQVSFGTSECNRVKIALTNDFKKYSMFWSKWKKIEELAFSYPLLCSSLSGTMKNKKMPTGTMDGFFRKVNLGQCPMPVARPSEQCYLIGRIFEKPIQKIDNNS